MEVIGSNEIVTTIYYVLPLLLPRSTVWLIRIASGAARASTQDSSNHHKSPDFRDAAQSSLNPDLPSLLFQADE